MMVALSLKISQCDSCSGLPMDRNPEQNDYSLLSLPKLELCKAKITRGKMSLNLVNMFVIGYVQQSLDSLVCHS